MRSFISSFISLIYPRTCVNCHRSLIDAEEHLCLHCILDLPQTNYQHLDSNPLYQKLISIPYLKNVFAYLVYQRGGITQRLLHQVKYAGNHELAIKLGCMFGEYLNSKFKFVDFGQIDMIIPIPLHSARLRRRGYNQAEKIAIGLGETINVPVATHLLQRIRHNTHQAKKSKLERWDNAKELFHVNQPEQLIGKTIMIIDDVITTGATIESAALTISNCAPKHICVGCIATGK